MAHWADMASDPEFISKFQNSYKNPEIMDADDEYGNEIDDTYLNMEVIPPRNNGGPEYAKVKRQLRDKNGVPIGLPNQSPFVDIRLYEVEFGDGYKESMAPNEIVANLFAQVDNEGNCYVVI